MHITDEQIEIINSFKCERLSADPNNKELIKKFYCERGKGLVVYLQQNAWKEDMNGQNAVYIVKTPDGLPCLFFALKSGSLFQPFDKSIIESQLNEAKEMLNLMLNTPEDDERRQNVIETLRRSDKQGAEHIVAEVVHIAQEQKTTLQRALSMYINDQKREGNRNIIRVKNTFPGVELTHFCTDDNTKKCWKKYGFRYPLGEVMFWCKIVPIILQIQVSIGCQFAFLFAADETPDGVLTNYYNVELKFVKLIDVGTNKPFYDFCCEFMSQEINNLRKAQEVFMENFNTDPDDVIV